MAENVIKIIKEVHVIPKDYEEIKAKNKVLEAERKKFAALMQNDRSVVMRDMVIKFERDIKTHAEAIAVEFMYVHCNREERACLIELIDFLRDVTDQLEQQLDKV